MRGTRLAALGLVAVLAAGLTIAGVASAMRAPSPAGAELVSPLPRFGPGFAGATERLASCSSPEGRFVIAVPSAWTASGSSCSGFEVSRASGVVLTVRPDAAAYAELAPSGSVSSRDEVLVGGRPGVRYETEYTGSDGRPARAYGYVVDRDGRGFVLAAIAPNADALAKARAAVDSIVASVAFS